MSRRGGRFRHLEMGGPDGEARPEPPPIVPSNTDVCRRCGTEQPEGSPRCTRCDGVLGGPGQDAFDRSFHAWRAAQEEEAVRTRLGRGSAPVTSPMAEAEGREPGFGTILGAGIFCACIFALVSIPVRLAFASAFREAMPWRAVSELLIVAVLTFVAHRALAPRLRRL